MAKKLPRDIRQGKQTINGRVVTPAQYRSGALLRAMTGPRVPRDIAQRKQTINGKTVTAEQWRSGDFLRALLGQKPGTPLPGQTPPAAPAPAAPGPAPLPPDAAYDAAMGAADLQYRTTIAGLTGARTRGLSDYGYSEGAIDPATGRPTFALDPNNPFSKAALLKQNYDRSRRSSAQSMGASGQLYSGAFQNQQDYTNRGELGAQDTLQKSLTDFLARNTTSQGQAGVDRATAYSAAAEGRQGRIDSNPLYDPAATIDTPAAPAAPAAAGFRTQAGTSPSGAKGVWHIYPDGRRVFVKK